MDADGRITAVGTGSATLTVTGMDDSRFTGSFSDHAPSNIVVMFSADEGETWTEPEVAIHASLHNCENVMSASLMRMQNGDIGLFHGAKTTPGVSRLILARSNDEGKTWYKHVECSLPDRPGYYARNNDRVERLSSGRIIQPMAFHRTHRTGENSFFWDPVSFNCFIYSDNDGETWAEAPETVYPNFPHTQSGLQEPGLIEKKDGTLWGYARTDKMYQYEYFSMDGGMHWTEPQPSRFTSPNSPMKIARHPGTGDLYAIWNPIPNYNGRPGGLYGGRTPFVWAVSKDDGATWSDYKVIEGKEDHGYCYPAVIFTEDNAMLVAYCAGGPEDGLCLARLTIMKIAI